MSTRLSARPVRAPPRPGSTARPGLHLFIDNIAVINLARYTTPPMKITAISPAISHTKHTYPLFESPVSAGFPSPADDYIEQDIDLHDYLVKNPPATFLVRAQGDSMIGAGIFSGDILVVDRSLGAQEGNIVIAVIDGDLTVKRISFTNSGVTLSAENEKYKPIHIAQHEELTIWGVVTNVIHSVR